MARIGFNDSILKVLSKECKTQKWLDSYWNCYIRNDQTYDKCLNFSKVIIVFSKDTLPLTPTPNTSLRFEHTYRTTLATSCRSFEVLFCECLYGVIRIRWLLLLSAIQGKGGPLRTSACVLIYLVHQTGHLQLLALPRSQNDYGRHVLNQFRTLRQAQGPN